MGRSQSYYRVYNRNPNCKYRDVENSIMTIRKKYRLAKEKIVKLCEFTVKVIYIALIFAIVFSVVL